MTNCVRWDP